MYQFFHDHVGSVELLDGGFQLRMSWGLVFGIPITLALIWTFNKLHRAWNWFATPKTAH